MAIVHKREVDDHPSPFNQWTPVYMLTGVLFRKMGFSAGKMLVFGVSFMLLEGILRELDGRESEHPVNAGVDLVAQLSGWMIMDLFESRFPNAKATKIR